MNNHQILRTSSIVLFAAIVIGLISTDISSLSTLFTEGNTKMRYVWHWVTSSEDVPHVSYTYECNMSNQPEIIHQMDYFENIYVSDNEGDLYSNQNEEDDVICLQNILKPYNSSEVISYLEIESIPDCSFEIEDLQLTEFYVVKTQSYE